MTWQIVIGLEIHAQLSARSKIFSPAAIDYCEEPNTRVREVDAGLPGALPVINRLAISHAISFGLAVSATVNRRSEFARKNYFYPDLPKGYQISQFEYPIVTGGELWIEAEGGQKRIGITRAHLEEDAGKLIHEGWSGVSGVDLNRAGTPLLEIVSEPDLRSIPEAVAYATAIHHLVRWLGICDGNMQEGSFRIDANLSLNRPDTPLGTRCEIKNLNSFRFLEQALNFERQRQQEVLEAGGAVVQETRLFDTAKGETRAIRGKEDAHDYRYFPDPDLPPLVIDDATIDALRQAMPPLPQACRQHLREALGLSDYDAEWLTNEREVYDYFNAVLAAVGDDEAAKLCANWLCGDFSALLNEHKTAIAESPIAADRLAGLIEILRRGDISGKIGKEVLVKMWESGDAAERIVEREGWAQINDAAVLEKMAADIIAAHPEQVNNYRAGKDKLFGFFVGQMMKASGGRANPEEANRILKRLLA